MPRGQPLVDLPMFRYRHAMNIIVLEIALIVLLVAANGLFAMAEMAIVVARNVLERRREFGLLEAVGFLHRKVRLLVFAVHRWLIILGLLSGAVSAILAVLPQLQNQAGGFPFLGFGALFAALAAGCVLWTWLATRITLRGSQLPALRNE